MADVPIEDAGHFIARDDHVAAESALDWRAYLKLNVNVCASPQRPYRSRADFHVSVNM